MLIHVYYTSEQNMKGSSLGFVTHRVSQFVEQKSSLLCSCPLSFSYPSYLKTIGVNVSSLNSV